VEAPLELASAPDACGPGGLAWSREHAVNHFPGARASGHSGACLVLEAALAERPHVGQGCGAVGSDTRMAHG